VILQKSLNSFTFCRAEICAY